LDKTIEYLKKALEIQERLFTSQEALEMFKRLFTGQDNKELAKTYNSIGAVYFHMRIPFKAFFFFVIP